jgi:membrane fusion protein (multidrug efflux system)
MFSRKIQSAISIFGIFLIIACSNKSQQSTQGPPPAVAVTLDTAKTMNAAYNDEYPATIVALNQVELRPQVSGFITGVHFTDGAQVRKANYCIQLINSYTQPITSRQLLI